MKLKGNGHLMNQGIPKTDKNRSFQMVIFLFVTLFCSLMFSRQVFAHAILEQANPSENSQLKTAPAQVELTFNERLEKELYFIRVFNQQGQQITKNSALMSTDQTKLTLKLPPIKEGIYTVTYHVISADGHPVEQSYVFSVGVSKESAGLVNSSEEHQHGSLAVFVDRILYYLSLLFLTGWLFWGIYLPFSESEVRREYDYWLQYLKHFYLLMIFGVGIVQFIMLLSGFGIRELLSLLIATTFGQTWICSLLLSLLGYFVLRRRKWIDGLWIALLLVAEGINGHALTVHPPVLTVLLDILHLITASIWVGGLLILALIWRKYRDYMAGFLPLFSRMALFSLITLVVTGFVSIFLFLPKWSYLLATTWGYLIIAKIILVVFVSMVAGIIRLLMKKQGKKLGAWLKWDFMLMLTIIGVVGVLTYQSPIPANQPFYWHQMEPGIMVTTQITPKAPGNNQFSVEVTLDKKNTQLKHIELFLKNKDKGLAPISIPLNSAPFEESQGNLGSQNYRYSCQGPYLPFAGDWTVELRILDSNDDETVYTKDFSVY